MVQTHSEIVYMDGRHELERPQLVCLFSIGEGMLLTV